MELLMIKGKSLKDQGNPLGIITEDIKEGICSPHTEDLTMDCSLTCPKAQERSLLQKRHLEALNSLLIEEVMKSGQLSHLVKGIKKEKYESYTKNKFEGLTFKRKEIAFPSRGSNSSAPVVIKAKVFGREVNRVHMDSESSCEVIYKHCFMKLKPSIRASKVGSKVPLIGFSGEKSWSIGKIPLEIMIEDPPLTRKETLNFMIVKSNSLYNMLLGRTTMQKMEIVVSTIYGAIKFHTTRGIGMVFSTHESDKVREGRKKVRETPPASEKGVFRCTMTEEKVVVNKKYPEQTVAVGKQKPEHFKGRLRDLLRANADVFAWTHADMTRIPKTIIVKGKSFNTKHKLNEYSHVKPVMQKRRGLGPDRNTIACKEVEELTKAGILQEFKHQTWVANPVMVKKSDGGWRMYVDFIDINKACPKDRYPLPEIVWKVESLSGFRLKCFLDAYKGYHQIQMAEGDEDKTTFFAGEGVFCYQKTPFGLKNAGATYQRLVDKVFHDQIGRNLEAYVDNMVIKSTSEEEMLADIKETFEKFRSINMKLNPKKCSFGVEEGPFLGCLITK
ncbi:reverse transcriptase domain-containing protein [Tanacetum coccineum]|uniref:Reverse transcriptase domain-containing protein n=1 Tax=Tanacetum coccineum TaxID=301880 RepID=A0ABQ5H1Z6_9ASTR